MASHEPAAAIPVAYVIQSALSDASTAPAASQLLNDPASQAQLQQIANDFVNNVNSSTVPVSSPEYKANFTQSVDLADQAFYSTYGQEAFIAWDAARAAAAQGN